MNTVPRIFLNDLLGFTDLSNVRIRFNLRVGGTLDPVEMFKSGDTSSLLQAHYWNYGSKKSYAQGQITVGLIKLDRPDLWLLFHVGKITNDLNLLSDIGYEYKSLPQYEKYLGRLVVRFKNKDQNLIRKASSVIDRCDIHQILSDVFDDDIFPGYENVNIDWSALARLVTKESWITALQNQKGVYLLTDTSNGRMYVGSAYGSEMLLGRWSAYVRSRHGGNEGLKELEKEHIEKYFRFSILDIFKSTTADKIILARESWWKNTLMTIKHGYNRN